MPYRACPFFLFGADVLKGWAKFAYMGRYGKIWRISIPRVVMRILEAENNCAPHVFLRSEYSNWFFYGYTQIPSFTIIKM